MRWIWRDKWQWVAVLLAVAGLAGCGGGGEAEPPPPSAPILKVESRTQPLGVQDIPAIKSRAMVKGYGSGPVPVQIALGPLDLSKSAALQDSGAQLIGLARPIKATDSPAALAAQLHWQATPDGGLVSALSVSAEGAHGLRMALQVDSLPGNAMVRVYSQDHPETVFEISGQQILQSIDRNLAAGGMGVDAHTWWTPELGSAEQTLEIELPRGTSADMLRVSVPQVSHIFEDLSLPSQEALSPTIKVTDPCNLDATCHDDVANLRDAVARMIFTNAGQTYACTGTLLNDSQSSGTPYFLSANHCISSQTVASTLQTDWFYRSATCNSQVLSSASTRRLGGATLLYASAASDTSFMRLVDTPPPGAVFAGWDAAAQLAGESVVGLHHPQADFLKVSYGSIGSQTNCASTSSTQFSCTGTSGNFYRVLWTSGTTQGGSSGSALFHGNYVVGTLYGGDASCSLAGTADYYGRFDIAYAAGLKQWLGAATVPARTPVFRFFNTQTGAHFYTASADERDFVIRTYPVFQYENVAFYAYPNASSGMNPVFRFFNTASGAHFYTISAGERDFVEATYPTFRYEGPSWYAQTIAGNGATPMFRFFNTRTGAHFYTISSAERDFVVASYPDFRYEGTAYFAWTTP